MKIDFVILWVNGNDPVWVNKKNLFLNKSKSKNYNGNNSSVRYRDYGTLRFVLRSMYVYAPWVNNIYLVTDNQTPLWWNKNNKKLHIIDHKQIIENKYLPLFNSNAIELNIDKIPDLSNNFVYFNDDTLLNKPVKKDDFFKNGLPRDFRLYTDMIALSDFDHIPLNNNILINEYVKNKWPLSKHGLFDISYGHHFIKEIPFLLQAKKRGISGYQEPHGPLSLKKDTFKLARKIWPNELKNNNNHRFRQMDDISIWLLRHLQLELGNFDPISPKVNRSYTINDIELIAKDLDNELSRSICINDDVVPNFNEKSKEIYSMLSKKYPHISPFEKE